MKPPEKPKAGRTRISTSGIDIRWKETAPGTEIEGVWRGTKPSTNPEWPDLGLLEIGGELKVLGMPTTLGKLLVRVPLGTKVWIAYKGMAKSKRGAEYHDFVVDISEGVDLLPAKPDDEKVPF